MSVLVRTGAIADDLDIAGQTVCQARAALEKLYNISPDAVATLNGGEASDNDTLRNGDELTFSKPLAQKGVESVTIRVRG